MSHAVTLNDLPACKNSLLLHVNILGN